MDTVSRRMGMQYPEIKDWGIQLQTFYDLLVPVPLRTALVVLMGAVVLVLLIASANVANLLLSRAASRRKEIAVRIAVGAGRGRLLGQLFTESLTLAVAGGAAGLALAEWAVELMNRSLPPNLLPVEKISLDPAVLLFSLSITVASGVLFGLMPAWQASRTDLAGVLKEGGRASVGGPRTLLRNGLVAGELALATMLLIGAGLLLESLLHLQNVGPGVSAGRPADLPAFATAGEVSEYRQVRGALPRPGGSSARVTRRARRGSLERGAVWRGFVQPDAHSAGGQVVAATGRLAGHRLARGESGLLSHAADPAAEGPAVHRRGRFECAASDAGESRNRQAGVGRGRSAGTGAAPGRVGQGV